MARSILAPVETVLAEHYGIRAESITRITRGHTNESFAVGDRLVARRGWANKPLSRIGREERVVTALGVPRIVETKSGALHAVCGDRVVHVFERCPGEPGPMWLTRGDERTMCSAMEHLADLHARLADLSPVDAGPWTWLHERVDRVRATDLPEGGSRVLDRIAAILDEAPALGRVQWLHGDYHLGNILLHDGSVTAAVDLDDTAPGSALGEAATALFALARRNEGEEQFAYDAALWSAGEAAYGTDLPPPDVMLPIFCAQQVLVHLEAAQHGWWKLEPGIGFWPCWHALR
jgi:aminoglycoside phosphotransferase (APT) family kinase protein